MLNSPARKAASASPGARHSKSVFVTLLITLALITVAGITGSSIEAKVSDTSSPTPVSFPLNITAAPDGSVWYTESRDIANNLVQRTSGGTLTKFPIPSSMSDPGGMDTDSNGDIWFTEKAGDGRLVMFDTSGSSFIEFPTPVAGGAPYDVSVALNDDVWFSLRDSDQIGVRRDSGAWGIVGLNVGAEPHGIAAGLDENVLIAAPAKDRIYEWTKQGTLRYWGLEAGTNPQDIVVDGTGNVWFSGQDRGTLGRIMPSHQRVEYDLPGESSEPLGLDVARVTGSGHRTDPVWVALTSGVGVVSACGVQGEHTLDSTYHPMDVAVEDDFDAWFTDIRGNRISRIFESTSGLTLVASKTLLSYPSGVVLSGTLKDGATPLSGRTIKMLYKEPGDTTWTSLTNLTTSGSGAFNLTDFPSKNRVYAANFSGDNVKGRAFSPQPCVELEPRLSASYSDTVVRPGEQISISGSMTPIHKWSPLRLEVKDGENWRWLAGTAFSANGSYTIKWTPAATGEYVVRVTFRGDADNSWVSTSQRIIAVN